MSKYKKYEEKRNFDKTPEPNPSPQSTPGKKQEFVIQKHDASRLHYDFRLEIGGALKSWVLPKGPSTDPAEKRLAIPTEDHPLEYADFEGVIPEGQYGGGTVMIWDRGSFRNIREQSGEITPLEECYEEGHIEIYLEGEKIYGGYALVKSSGRKMDGNWLLVKMSDDKADARRNPTSVENRSVKSGRTLGEIREEGRKNK